mgnify:CR=1 FL=1
MFSALWNIILQLYAVLALLPFVSFFLFWAIAYAVKKERKKATQIAMDVTTLLLVGIVSSGIDNVFPNFIGGIWIVILIFLLMAGLIGNAQNRIHGQVDVRRLLRAVWRIGFFILAVAYILLVLIGLIKWLCFTKHVRRLLSETRTVSAYKRPTAQ